MICSIHAYYQYLHILHSKSAAKQAEVSISIGKDGKVNILQESNTRKKPEKWSEKLTKRLLTKSTKSPSTEIKNPNPTNRSSKPSSKNSALHSRESLVKSGTENQPAMPTFYRGDITSGKPDDIVSGKPDTSDKVTCSSIFSPSLISKPKPPVKRRRTVPRGWSDQINTPPSQTAAGVIVSPSIETYRKNGDSLVIPSLRDSDTMPSSLPGGITPSVRSGNRETDYNKRDKVTSSEFSGADVVLPSQVLVGWRSASLSPVNHDLTPNVTRDSVSADVVSVRSDLNRVVVDTPSQSQVCVSGS